MSKHPPKTTHTGGKPRIGDPDGRGRTPIYPLRIDSVRRKTWTREAKRRRLTLAALIRQVMDEVCE